MVQAEPACRQHAGSTASGRTPLPYAELARRSRHPPGGLKRPGYGGGSQPAQRWRACNVIEFGASLHASDMLTAYFVAATLQKMVREALPQDVRIAGDAVELILECCTGTPDPLCTALQTCTIFVLTYWSPSGSSGARAARSVAVPGGRVCAARVF